MNAIVKKFLRKAITAACIVVFFFWQGQTAYAFWLPVLVAALVALVFEQLAISGFLTAVAYVVIAAASYVYLGGGIWGAAGVFAFPTVYVVVMGIVKLLDGQIAKPAEPAK